MRPWQRSAHCSMRAGDRAVDRYPSRLDVLVNNAGVIRNGSLEDTTEEDIEYTSPRSPRLRSGNRCLRS